MCGKGSDGNNRHLLHVLMTIECKSLNGKASCFLILPPVTACWSLTRFDLTDGSCAQIEHHLGPSVGITLAFGSASATGGAKSSLNSAPLPIARSISCSSK